METRYTWKSKFFRSQIEIFKYDEPAGELTTNGWRRTSNGTLNGKKTGFDIRGLFGKEFIILNPDDKSEIGQIVFNTWRTKATININGRSYNWQYDNFWNTNWSITNEKGNLVQYSSSFRRGEILTYIDDEVLILTGLYIRDYLQKRAAAASAAT
jgi:hypothetical protein